LHAPRLAGQGSFTKKIVRAQDGDNCFFALFRDDRKLYLASLDVEYRVGRVAL
jgi:hypothetical protein